MKRLLFVLLLAGCVSATSCTTGCFYSVTVPVNSFVNQLGIGDKIGFRFLDDGTSFYDCGVNSSLINVFYVLNNSATQSFSFVGRRTDGEFVFRCDSPNPNCYLSNTDKAYVTFFVNGSTNTYSTTSQYEDYMKYFTGSSFASNSQYIRNWTFRGEDNNSLYSFSGTNASLQVLCPTLGTTTYNLSSQLPSGGSLIVRTFETPRFSLMVNGIERLRSEPNYAITNNFYMLLSSQQYRFNLVDYSSQCNGILIFYANLDGVWSTVWSGYFGLERDAYVFLSNSTYYKIRLYCYNGGMRDFGVVSLGGNYVRNIEVTNIDIGGGSTAYSGNLSLKFSAATNLTVLSLNYGRTDGLTVDSVNFSIYDTTTVPYNLTYSSVSLNTQSGAINYNVDNLSRTYLLKAVVVNNGSLIQKMQTSDELLLNYSSSEEYYPGVMKPRRLIDLGLPPTILGVSDDTIYWDICMGTTTIIGLGFAAIDALFAGIALSAIALLFDLIKWWDIPAYLKVVVGLFALACYWGMYRRTDE